MSTRETYLSLLAQHGRRVANRFAYAELRESSRDPLESSLGEFYESVYEMYGHEDRLPPHERSRPGDPVLKFDPVQLIAHYRPHGSRFRLASRIKGTTRDWVRELIGTDLDVLKLIALLVRGDERMLAWMETPEAEEWRAFDDSLNDADLQALRILLSDDEPTPEDELWPAPGSSEAAAWLESRRKD